MDITGGSLYADRCLFMMKCYSELDTDGCHPNLIVDGTELSVGEENMVLQLMTSDDCGLNYEALQVPEIEDDFSQVECLIGTMVQKTYTEGFPPTIMYVFDINGEEVGVSGADYDAFVAENPEAAPVMVEYEPQQDSAAIFKNLSVEGDIYNAVVMVFLTVSLAETLCALNMRSRSGSIFRREMLSNLNWWLLGAAAITVVLTLAAVYLPGFKELFGIHGSLTAGELLISAGLAASTIPVFEEGKAIQCAVRKGA